MGNKNRVCQICNKCFSGGKAMGGHMRSHLAKLPIPPKRAINNPILNSAELTHHPTQSLSSSSSLTFHPKKNPIQNFQSLNHNFLAFLANSNRESESESYPKNPTRKRSKRRRKFIAVVEAKVETKQMSSIFDALLAEEAARTLLMISKDKWPESKEIKTQKMKEKSNRVEAKDDENEKDDSLVQIHSRARYKCEVCSKMFQSYQALGGHKANHKKIKNLCQEDESEYGGRGKSSDVVDQKVFECPYCSKVFDSGQALGGHKKVHFSNAMVANAHNTANISGKNFLDLNLPAPREDEEISHIELSTVSSEE